MGPGEPRMAERGGYGHKSGAAWRRSPLYSGGRRAERRVCNFSPLSFALFPPTPQHALETVVRDRSPSRGQPAIERDYRERPGDRSSSNPPATARASARERYVSELGDGYFLGSDNHADKGICSRLEERGFRRF